MGMAEHDGKVTFDLELDDSKLRGNLARAIGQVKSLGNAKIKVEADTGGALQQLKGVQTAANDLGGKHTITVDADTATANQNLEATKGRADGLTGKHTVTVDANTTTADQRLAQTEGRLDGLDTTRTVTVSADTVTANRHLEETEGELNGLTNGARTITVNADTATADAALGATYGLMTQVDALDPHITVTADTSQADAALSSTLSNGQNRTTGGAGGNKESSGGGVLASLASIPVIGKAAAALKLGKEIFTAGMDYDYGMAKASTLMPDYADQEAFGQSILNLSSETGISAPQLLESSYNALSASVPYGDANGDNLIDFLRTSAALSVSGYASSDDVTKVLGSISNAYHGEYSPSEIGNIAIKTQNKGQLTVGDIVQSAPNFMSNAASQHVPLDQAMSMFAAMTLGGVQPAQASTAMNALFTELQRPQSEGYKAMQGAFASNPQLSGKNLMELMDSGVTMMDIVSGMGTYMSRNNLAPAAVLPGEALRAYNTLSGENMPAFQSAYGYISGPENALQSAYDIMMGTQQSKWGIVKNNLRNAGVNISQAIKPSVDLGLEGLTNPKSFFREAADHSIVGNLFAPLRDWIASEKRQTAAESEYGFRGGGAGRTESKINPTGGENAGTLDASVQSAASLTTAMEDLSTSTESSAESAQATAEAQAANAENQAAISESAATVGESSAQAAASLETAAQNAATEATATGSAAKSASNSASRAASLASKIGSLNSNLGGAASAASGLPGAVNSLVASIRAAGAKVQAPTATKYAVGLDYVPYDNYPAILHKGEMVLTAAQASAFRFGGAGSSGGGIDAGALASAMAGLSVEMDGRVVGRLVERSVSAQQAVRLNRTQYGRD